ncbi:MAG: hypothetical protein ACRD2O_08630 [Terriglobia bacterium]
MNILLDECLPQGLRKHIVGHHCEAVARAGFSGKANGELFSLAERSGWQALLTMDKGMPGQQNLAGRTISLVVIRAKSNRLPDLLPHVSAILTGPALCQAGSDRTNRLSKAAGSRRVPTSSKSAALHRFPSQELPVAADTADCAASAPPTRLSPP